MGFVFSASCHGSCTGILVGNVDFRLAVCLALAVAVAAQVISRMRRQPWRSLEVGSLLIFVLFAAAAFLIDDTVLERCCSRLATSASFGGTCRSVDRPAVRSRVRGVLRRCADSSHRWLPCDHHGHDLALGDGSWGTPDGGSLDIGSARAIAGDWSEPDADAVLWAMRFATPDRTPDTAPLTDELLNRRGGGAGDQHHH
jgi:hypothetical protein